MSAAIKHLLGCPILTIIPTMKERKSEYSKKKYKEYRKSHAKGLFLFGFD